VIRRGAKSICLLALAGGLVAAFAAPAQAADSIAVDVAVPKRVDLLDKLTITGTVTNPQPTDDTTVTVEASGRQLFRQKVDASSGTFSLPLVVDACCGYTVTAKAGDKTATAGFVTTVPKKLRKGKITRLYNSSLQDLGFHTGTKGSKVTEGTRLATKAFRKVNGMRRSEAYNPEIFRMLLQNRGAFKVQFPNDGRHVEVDIGDQTMALIEGDRPVHTFHVSTGTGGTPTVRGNYRFYRKDPGYNEKRMYYSAYFIRGYATHGYSSVPNHNASHGCVRNPIQFSRFIYNWIDIGMPIHTYG
jgi:hypothetical protein